MKPGTYTKLLIQIVFTVKSKHCVLKPEQNKIIYSYISGIITARGHKSFIVNGYHGHVHVLIGLNPDKSISDTVRDIKRSSSMFINKQNWLSGLFRWQEGYGAFSYTKSELSRIYNYIENQEEHHRKKSFRHEYIDLLKEHDVDYDERFLLESFD